MSLYRVLSRRFSRLNLIFWGLPELSTMWCTLLAAFSLVNGDYLDAAALLGAGLIFFAIAVFIRRPLKNLDVEDT